MWRRKLLSQRTALLRLLFPSSGSKVRVVLVSRGTADHFNLYGTNNFSFSNKFCVSATMTDITLKGESVPDVENNNSEPELVSSTAAMASTNSSETSLPSAAKPGPDGTPVEQPLSRRAQKKRLRAQQHRQLKMKRKAKNLQVAQKEDAGYNIEDFEQSEYYFENGLRKVYPYQYVFATYAKGRWVKRQLQEVLAKEFGYDHPDELKQAFEGGRIHVNNQRVSVDHVVQDCDYISHRTHRHENPVTAARIEVIEDTENLLVVNKPSSIPCHPCGRYRFNSIVFILGKELGYTNLRNIYRLDRLTSGVLMLGKTPEYTKVLEDQVANRVVEKEYVCRVVGKFPDDPVTVEQPLQALSNKLRLQIVSPTGKASTTHFKRLSYNGTSSVVKCFPKTGRTHQIRVHLQYLGHPIINDYFYNSEAWGPNKGKDADYGVAHDQVCERILSEHYANLWDGGDNPLYKEKFGDLEENKDETADSAEPLSTDCSCIGEEKTANPDSDEPLPKRPRLTDVEVSCPVESDTGLNTAEAGVLKSSTDQQTVEGVNGLTPSNEHPVTSACCRKDSGLPEFDVSKVSLEFGCNLCKRKGRDPTEKHLVMFLHALKYKGPGWQYETTLPDWAQPDWNKESDFML
ncbi:RNA pseudouridylate synthase domain-containing protein 2 [Aplysia californica]|uniref:RNA pseudouridylate synthase domain-containing protein 2 n=1 Tax=Aplysia californica TaxID=6500 RepID=A0ABM0K6H9_APLCA|nr:RNA pseudouridylate synthase domain-containing protein 2 [Aplysia californica]